MFRADLIKIRCFRYNERIEAEANGHHLADDIYNCILLNENCCMLNHISMKRVPYSPINNEPTLFKIMAWLLNKRQALI